MHPNIEKSTKRHLTIDCEYKLTTRPEAPQAVVVYSNVRFIYTYIYDSSITHV